MEKIQYCVLTVDGFWGTGSTLYEAAKQARFIKRKSVKAVAYRATITKPLTEGQIKDLRSRFSGIEYQPGDLCDILVSDYGGVTIYGATLERADDLKNLDKVVFKNCGD